LLTSSTFYSIEGLEEADMGDCTSAKDLLPVGMTVAWQALEANKWYYYSSTGNDDPSGYLVTSSLGHGSSSYSLRNYKGNDPAIGNYDYRHVGKNR